MAPQSWRRRHFRFPALDASVNGGAVDGQLLNVARAGLAVETTSRIQVGRDYRLKVSLEEAAFVAKGRVRWCSLKETRRNELGEVTPVYHAGFSLEETDHQGQDAVLDKLRRRLLTVPPT